MLDVEYPDDYPAHCKTQQYYVGDAFMLRRLDYAPDIILKPENPSATAVAQYTFDATEFSGLQIPTFRRVVFRKPEQPPVNGRPALGGSAWLSGPTVFTLVFTDVVVRDG